MGRSGTTFIANLLNNVEDISVEHEFIGNREFWLLSWYLGGNDYAQPFLERSKATIENQFNKKKLFIDVNGYLQNCVAELRIVFKPKVIFHLVRDGRDVVRSIYTRRSEKDIHLIPKSRNEIYQWVDMDKFAQICWNWRTTTEYLLESDTKMIKFEEIIGDYGYFKNNLLDTLDVNISESLWKNRINIKHNKTSSKLYRYLYAKIKGKEFIADRLPRYENWTDRQREIFHELCGSTMNKVGYKL